MNKPGQLTAMISSTALDLPEHRQRVMEACQREGIFPIGMEHLPARDASGIRVSLEMVDQADIYIGVYAWRYGWVPDFDNPDKISITEMEFNRGQGRTVPLGSRRPRRHRKAPDRAVSRHAVASGSRDDCGNRGLTPNG